jgi:hypothetical protein
MIGRSIVDSLFINHKVCWGFVKSAIFQLLQKLDWPGFFDRKGIKGFTKVWIDWPPQN